MMHIGSPGSRILLPARGWFIALSIAIGFVLDLLPMGYSPTLPDFSALILCFWAIREPRRVGMGIALILGIFADVAAGSVMGQHALAYVALAYLCGTVSRRVVWFDLVSQAAHVWVLLLIATCIRIASGLVGGGEFPGWAFLIGPLIGAVLWIPMNYLLLLPQYQPIERDDNRPI
ncbi:MAG TPA: rod shape-determining protein MreD [Rhodocyclaceae bacterium]